MPDKPQPIEMIKLGRNEFGERKFSVKVNGVAVLENCTRYEAEREMNIQNQTISEKARAVDSVVPWSGADE